jgi:4-hydroxy 2-oxovalerate aldolase
MTSTAPPTHKLLDCTLRDGGHVNDFAFGVHAIGAVVTGLVQSRVDIIELGFLKNGHHAEGQTLYTHVSDAERHVRAAPAGVEYSLMIRPDWYDIRQLAPCQGSITTIRFAFHADDLPLALQQADRARGVGYRVFLNPVNVPGYSPGELTSLLASLNAFGPDAVCIVDTFGSLLPDDLHRILRAFLDRTDPRIGIGLHLHENLSISLALAHDFLRTVGHSRSTCIDSSVMGMGRIPGNLCTELIMEYLNRTSGHRYEVQHVYGLISDVIADLKQVNPWGYLPAYAQTAFRHLHRSYAEFLLDRGDLSLVEIAGILDRITEPTDRNHFNEDLIHRLYRDHQAHHAHHA